MSIYSTALILEAASDWERDMLDDRSSYTNRGALLDSINTRGPIHELEDFVARVGDVCASWEIEGFLRYLTFCREIPHA